MTLHKKLEFLNKGWINYEFLKREKFKKQNDEIPNLKIEFWANDLRIHL